MNQKTKEAVIRHGNSLLAVFTECTEKDPVALCKKLRRIEARLEKAFTAQCNGNIGTQEACIYAQKQLEALEAILRPCEAHSKAIRINHDPRGYALKLDDGWTQEWNQTAAIPIQTDWGQYGILAPDLTTK